VEQSIWEIISVFLLSTVKFVFGAVPLALAFGFSFFETIFITSIGGFAGVLVFVFLSDILIKRIKENIKTSQSKNSNYIPKKKFTKKNKMIVTVKNKFGIFGICVLTPLLFSIPLGCLLAVRYFKEKQKIIAYMFGSILFWSVSIASFKLLF